VNATKGKPSIQQKARKSAPDPWHRLRRAIASGELRRLSPEQRGYHDGWHDRHYLPTLNYRMAEEWIAWRDGWRRGQAERRAKLRAEGRLWL